MDIVNAAKSDVLVLGLITAVAAEQLNQRIKGYEDGTLEKNTDLMLRDLKAAVNSVVMLNTALLEQVENDG